MPPGMKRVKCKFYDPMTGKPNPIPCPRNAKICWFIHPTEPEWCERGGGISGGQKTPSSPRKHGGGRGRNSSSSRGRGRSRSRSRTRSRSRDVKRRGRSRSRSRSSGRFVSPNRRRPRHSSPPRRPLHERTHRSYSPRPRSKSRPRRHSPTRRRTHDRRPRTPTPISSSRGYTPPPRSSKLDRSPRAVKLEPSTDALPNLSSNPVQPASADKNTSGVGDQPPVRPRGFADRQHHQPSSLDLSLGQRATATSTSPQPFSPRTAPFSPIFAPETPIIPGLPTSAQLTRPQITALLDLVIKDQATGQTMQPPSTPPIGSTSALHPTTTSDGGKTGIWTARIKLWTDLMNTKSAIMDWEEETKAAQSLKNRAGFDAFSTEVQAQVDSRITYAANKLVQYQLAFEALIFQSIELDRSVSKTNAALTPAPDPRATTPREIEWMEERIRVATARMDELEKKLTLQDQMLERLKAEQEAVAALPPLPPAATASPRSSTEVDDEDGVLDMVPSLKRKRGDEDEPRPSLRHRSLARSVADLQELNEALVDRIAEAEGTIEGILNDVVEDPEGEESSRATRLKEIVQDYLAFIENAKASIEATQNNSGVVEALKIEAERAIANWNEEYQVLEAAQNEAGEIQARETQRAEENAKKREEVASIQRQVEALNVTVQAFVEQQSAQPGGVLTLEQVIEALKPILAEEMREATRPLLSQKHEELQQMLTDHIEAVRVSIYEPVTLSEQVARTMLTWLEAEFGCGAAKR